MKENQTEREFCDSFSDLLNSVVSDSFLNTAESLPSKEGFQKVLSSISVESPFQDTEFVSRKSIIRSNSFYTSMTNMWKVAVPVIALVAVVGGGTYYYQSIGTVAPGPVSSVTETDNDSTGNSRGSATSVARDDSSDTRSLSDIVEDIEASVSSEMTFESDNTKADSAADAALVTSDSEMVHSFNTNDSEL